MESFDSVSRYSSMKALPLQYSMIELHLFMVFFRKKFLLMLRKKILLTCPHPQVSLCDPLHIKMPTFIISLLLIERCLVFFIFSIRHLLHHMARNKRLWKQQLNFLNQWSHVTYVDKL